MSSDSQVLWGFWGWAYRWPAPDSSERSNVWIASAPGLSSTESTATLCAIQFGGLELESSLSRVTRSLSLLKHGGWKQTVTFDFPDVGERVQREKSPLLQSECHLIHAAWNCVLSFSPPVTSDCSYNQTPAQSSPVSVCAIGAFESKCRDLHVSLLTFFSLVSNSIPACQNHFEPLLSLQL